MYKQKLCNPPNKYLAVFMECCGQGCESNESNVISLRWWTFREVLFMDFHISWSYFIPKYSGVPIKRTQLSSLQLFTSGQEDSQNSPGQSPQ